MENNIYIFAQRNTFSCAKEYINAIINVKMRKEEGSIRIHEGKLIQTAEGEEEESSMIFIAVQISAFSMFILQEYSLLSSL